MEFKTPSDILGGSASRWISIPDVSLHPTSKIPPKGSFLHSLDEKRTVSANKGAAKVSEIMKLNIIFLIILELHFDVEDGQIKVTDNAR
jgi:hypothetical protein